MSRLSLFSGLSLLVVVCLSTPTEAVSIRKAPLHYDAPVQPAPPLSAASTSSTNALFVTTSTTATGTDVTLDVPPRFMWGWGPGLSGYCGETSFQSHGIFYGNWVSEEIVRYAAGSELLISVNDQKAAKKLKFTYEWFDNDKASTPQASAFLSFVKKHIDAGHIVATGFYEKMPKGDADYDHIMPIIGYKSLTTGGSYAVAGVYYNDLYGKTTRYLDVSNGVTTRSGCSQSSSPSQPYNYCLPQTVSHGIALVGNVDTDSLTFRVKLAVSRWDEPDWGAEDKLHQAPVPLTMSATISGLRTGVTYLLLRFDSSDALPTTDFINGSYGAQFEFVAKASTHTLSNFDTVMSDGQFFYRCVQKPLQ